MCVREPGQIQAGRLVGWLLPARVCVVESRDDRDVALFPAEAAHIRGAAPARRTEFITVRAHAREALRMLGRAPAALVPGDHGAPRWPDGIVGSTTHCDGYRAAALALSGDVATIGIDVETDEPLPEGVLELVATADERSHLAELPPTMHWDRLVFCMKEATYKAWYPATGEWLDFADVSVRFCGPGRFTAQVRRLSDDDGAWALFHGRWTATSGHLAAAIAVLR